MQLTLKSIVLAICVIQAFKPEAFIWAKDAPLRSSVEQTTHINSNEEGATAKPNSLENLASRELLDEQTTTTAAVGSCENYGSDEIVGTCNCRCVNKDQSGEATTAAASAEQTTTGDQSAETTEAATANNKPLAGASANTEKPSPNFTCEAAGNFAHPTDCRRYYNCSTVVGSNNFEVTENVCPENQAFNVEFSSCMRDLSSCSRQQRGFECTEAGSFADAQSNAASYYRCVPRLGDQLNPTYHLFRVNCGVGKVFMSQLGKCFYDLNAPQTGFNSKEYTGMPDDEQLVKAELKQWKLKEKTKLKEEKLKEKYEQKLQKELAKKASKEGKEKAKKEEKAKKGKNNYYDDYD